MASLPRSLRTPASRRGAVFAGVLAFAAVLTSILLPGSWRRDDFRVDEAHKISESAFLGLWLQGDFSNPAWSGNIVDRTNPPVGKYAIGAAILLGGHELPSLPTLPVRHSGERNTRYRPLLPSARFPSMLATALTAALLATLLARYRSPVAAAIAVVLHTMTGLTRICATWAVFDALFTLFFLCVIALAVSLASAATWRRIVVTALAIGVAAALVFQTRLNGLYAFLIAVPFMAMALKRRAPAAIAIAGVAFVLATLALNPYYWSDPLERLLQQKSDLESLAAPLQEGRAEGRTVPEKALYLLQVVMLDAAGAVTTLAALAGLVLAAVRWRATTPPMRMVLLLSAATIVTMVATLPLPWPRYLLVTVPPLALLAAFAIAPKTKGSRG